MTGRHDSRTNLVRTQIYVDGAWIASAGTGTISVVDPTTATDLGSIPAGSSKDVDVAVHAARRAFDSWSQTDPVERAEYLTSIADKLEQRAGELAELIALEVGMPKTQCLDSQVPIGDFRVNAELARTYAFETVTDGCVILHDAVGVVAAITPWNYPLGQIASKVAPALAAGCTVIVKPSEVAPLNAFVLAEIVHEIDLPAGVFNLIAGDGPTVGQPLVAHPDVDMISFTGSTLAGKHIGEVAMQRVARITLELGGKSPLIILDDADLEQAVTYGVRKCYSNSGQTCNALTRMLVPRESLAQAEAAAARAADGITVGDPLDDTTQLGPLVSQEQQTKVREFIRHGIAEGAKLVAGGAGAVDGAGDGFFVRPTVFSGVNEMAIAREEIFGPVLVIIPYEDEADAIRIANDSEYGLWGGVWSASDERARGVARQMRVGGVSINGASATDWSPFGGYKQSGLGREMGRFGFEEYLEIKALIV